MEIAHRGWMRSWLGGSFALLLMVAAPGGATRAQLASDPQGPSLPTGASEHIRAEVARHLGLKPGRVSVLVHVAKGAERRPIRAFAQSAGGFVRYEYEILPEVMNLRDIPFGAVTALERLPGVSRVEFDDIVHASLNDSTPVVRGLQSQLASSGLSATGAGARVCVCDTGIDTNHIMYSTRIDAAAGWDYVNNDSKPEDDNGHGAHVAGIVAGRAGLDIDFGGGSGAEPFQGVAPEATLIGVKVLNASGSGTVSNIIAGINRCASTSLANGQADVINLSLGGGQYSGTCNSDSLAAAANNAVAAGVVVIAAAGNENYSNALGTPACASNVIAVGATWDDDFPNPDFPADTSFTFCTTVNSFGQCTATCTDSYPARDQRVCLSNRSTLLDVTAPGCLIYSSDAKVSTGGGIVDKCGTSQSAPHVAGLAALLRAENPSLSPADIQLLLQDGAEDLGAAGFDTSYGWGRIDAVSSLLLLSPTCVLDADCDDGLYCNGAESCVAGACQAGLAPNCSDGISCTTDSCNEAVDACSHVANNAACSDGQYCNGAETCSATLGCQPGTAPNCADAVPCTVDSCNETTDACVHTPNHAACSDGAFCNGAEACHATLGCQPGAAPNCGDAVACTVDSCNEATDSCVHTANDVACDDGLFCTGAETCSATAGCQPGTAPCPGQSCDEGTAACVACTTDGDCDDGLHCNGAETCSTGTCQAGVAPACDDGISCTVDQCNEATNSCDNTPIHAACNDGQFCNGAELCSAMLGCQPGGSPCGGAACSESTDSCVSATKLWLAFADSTSVPGVGTVDNEDVVAYDPVAGTWSMVFDGSDVGLAGLAIDGLARTAAGDLLLSFATSASLAGMTGGPGGSTTLESADIVRFVPTNLGTTTSGTFAFYFDGSDVGLTASGENVDAIALDGSGGLLLSTTGSASVTGASASREDLLRFNPTSLGATTAGTFALYFDGSDVGLANSNSEDVDAADWTASGMLLLSTLGNFGVTGLSGGDEDVLAFTPAQLGATTVGSYSMFSDLSALGIHTSEDVAGVELVE